MDRDRDRDRDRENIPVKSSRILVAGGGLIGCAIAWRLAQRGAHVRVIESSRPGMAASWAAAGMLAPLLESVHAPLRSLATQSIARFPAFVQELKEACGIDAELQLSGKIDVAFRSEEMDTLRLNYGELLPGGVREISAVDMRALEPEVSVAATGAIFSDHDGSVDNRKLTRAAWLAASTAGVEFQLESSVHEVVCGRAGFEAVRLTTGEQVGADAVVIAAGAWSGSIHGLPRSLPVFPVRGQIVALEHIPRVLSHLVMTTECYIVPRLDGRVLVGSTVERAGFDARTTALGISRLMAGAIHAVPRLAEATVVETWAGLRPGTADDLPIMGADPRAPGVFYATGHYRNGILLAPITADMIAEAVITQSTNADIAAFAVNRFHD